MAHYVVHLHALTWDIDITYMCKLDLCFKCLTLTLALSTEVDWHLSNVFLEATIAFQAVGGFVAVAKAELCLDV